MITLELSEKLQKEGYPQPPYKAGQMWYFDNQPGVIGEFSTSNPALIFRYLNKTDYEFLPSESPCLGFIYAPIVDYDFISWLTDKIQKTREQAKSSSYDEGWNDALGVFIDLILDFDGS